MKKEKVDFNQLTAGALLKFGRLDSIDMTLLMGKIYDKCEIVNNEYDYGNNYFILCNGMILLNDEYVHRFWNVADEKVLESMQGNSVREYMNNLNITEFTLRKIRLLGLGCVVKDALEETFSEKQLKSIEELYQRGFIEDYIHEDARYGDYEAVRITQKGKLALFLIDNRKNVDSFFELIRYVGYDESFLNEFLLAQDLEQEYSKILTIDNFNEFRLIYDETPVSFKHTKMKKK